MSEQKAELAERQAWKKFEFLTHEMKRFLDQNDVDTFLNLLEQRNYFEKMIMTSSERTFVKSEEGRALLKELHAINHSISMGVQQWMNKTRGSRNATRAYESLGMGTSSGWSRGL